MRAIEHVTARAFIDRRAVSTGNTMVKIAPDATRYLLHGNEIARAPLTECGEGPIEITCAGWPTATTRSRLNALLNYAGSTVRVRQHDGRLIVSAYGGAEAIIDDCDTVRCYANSFVVL